MQHTLVGWGGLRFVFEHKRKGYCITLYFREAKFSQIYSSRKFARGFSRVYHFLRIENRIIFGDFTATFLQQSTNFTTLEI